MSDQDNDDLARDKREQRLMWIFSGVIAVLLLAMVGANTLFHRDQPAGNTEISSQSRPSPEK
jgi:hypothetical protein